MTKKILSFLLFAIVVSISFCNYQVYASTEKLETEREEQMKEHLEDFIDKKGGIENPIDDTIEGAQSFLNAGKETHIKEDKLKATSDFLFNSLLSIALVLAVIIGIIIGIKFMVASVEEKAKVKEALIPYVIGCVVVFGAFSIWSIAVRLLYLR